MQLNTMAKRKKKKQASKKGYAARRTLLILLFLALVGFAVWRLLPLFSTQNDETAEKSSISETRSESASESDETNALASSDSESESSSTDESEAENASEDTSSESSESESEASSSETEEAPPDDEEESPNASNSDDANWNLLLVNNANALPDGFSITLETLEDGYQVDARIADAVREMYTQARADGILLTTCSAYRSVDKQEQNYNNQIQAYLNQGDTQEEAEAKTAAYYATPGYSEHHTGLALDIVTPSYTALDAGYAETPAAKWLAENAHLYGFVLRYPEDKVNITQINFEPWHYRYVGKEHAAAMYENNYCLEEYLYVRLQSQLEQAQATEAAIETSAADAIEG